MDARRPPPLLRISSLTAARSRRSWVISAASFAGVLLQPGSGAVQFRLVLEAELQFLSGEPRVQLVPLPAREFVLGAQAGMLGGALGDGGQQGDLVLGAEDGVVGLLEVVEVVDEVADPGLDVVLFEHVGAHEVGDVLHLLHGHRAVEELHGLVAADTELPLERRRVRLESVMDGRAGSPELLLQLRRVLAEVGEVRGDGLLGLHERIETVRLPCLLGGPQGDGQGDGLAQDGVVEDAEHHREFARSAQCHRLGVLTARAAGALMEPPHIGHQGAFLLLRARGLVVLDPVGRQQQRGDGIHHGGLAGADVAGQQAVGSVQPEGPDLLVEGAPIEQLQAVQPKARGSAGVVRFFIQAEKRVLLVCQSRCS